MPIWIEAILNHRRSVFRASNGQRNEEGMSNLHTIGGVPGPGRIGRVAAGDILHRSARRFPERVAIVEGEKKCLSLHRLATYDKVTGADNAIAARWLALGIGGVWNWKGTRGKATNARGKPQPVKGPIPDLDILIWTSRLVYLCFDSDLDTNDEVRWARLALTRELIRRGALIRWVELKDHNGGPFPAKMGVDDGDGMRSGFPRGTLPASRIG